MIRITYAQHLRGKIKFRIENNRFSHGGKLMVFYWSVVNTYTGQLIASDSTGCDLQRAIAECDQLVGAARIAWMHELKQKELQ